MKRGKRTETYYAVARPSGRLSGERTDLFGPISSLEEAEYHRGNLGGHVVRVTKTETWEPVEISNPNPEPSDR